jgi:hypothetical protein
MRQAGVSLCLAFLALLRAGAAQARAELAAQPLALLPTAALVERVGKTVEIFGTRFSEVSCTESVTQAKLDKVGKVLFQQESAFDYLILMDLKGDEPSLEESRVVQKEARNPTNLPLLLTSGFPTLQLVFHPYYQGSFEYEKLPEESTEGKVLVRIRFRHVKGTLSTSALRLRGKDFPLDLEGIAWVDPDSAAIVRISAQLEAPLTDVGLKSLQADVRYAATRFPGIESAYSLPVLATVDVETLRQRWRNIHRFAAYRHFSVRSESTVAK